MNTTVKVLRTLAIIILIVAILTAIAGTVLMFFVAKDYQEYEPDFFEYRTINVHETCPESGAMPTIGTVFAIVALVFFILTKKKKKNVIGALVATIIAQVFLYTSVVLLKWNHAAIAWLGWYLCVGGAGAIGITCVFSIIILVNKNKSSSSVKGKVNSTQPISAGASVLWVLSIIIFAIAVALATVGTIIMFGDHVLYSNPRCDICYRETGIMPLFGAVLLIASLIMLILSRKRSKLVIGTWVATFVSQALLGVSLVFVHGVDALIGYWLCVGASSVASISFILSLIYGILSLRSGNASVAVASAVSVKDDYGTAFSQAAALLKEAKELLDSGIYTEEEFKMQKEMVFKRYGLFEQEKDAENNK